MKIFSTLMLSACSLCLVLPSANARPVISYHPEGEIVFGGKGGWDYLTVDPKTNHLFVTHSDKVVVIDLDNKSVIREIKAGPGIHGIAIASELNKAFISNGAANSVSVVNLDTFIAHSILEVGKNPDAIVYEPKSKEIYVFNGRSNSASVIDAVGETVKLNIDLPGKPEFAVVDSIAHRVFVNIENKNAIVALDTVTYDVAANWPLEKCQGPSGLALDARRHRLFSVCDNEIMVLVDAMSGRTLASAPIGKGTDGVAFDPELMLAFSANGKSGTVTVVREDSPETLKVIENLQTRIGARTIAVDTRHHRLFLPTAKFEKAVADSRPRPLDGSQTVLVFSAQ